MLIINSNRAATTQIASVMSATSIPALTGDGSCQNIQSLTGRNLYEEFLRQLPHNRILLGTATAVGFTLLEKLGQYLQVSRNISLETGEVSVKWLCSY